VRLVRPLLLASLAMLVFGAVPASASVQIGQLNTPYNAGSCAGSASFQTTVETGTNSYAMPFDGVIVGWQTKTGTNAGTMKLKVFRATTDPTEFLVVGEEGPHSIAKETSPSFTSGVRIPVKKGDFLGETGAGTNCTSYLPGQNGYHTLSYELGVDPLAGTTAKIFAGGSQFALEVQATLEPDADQDGYGDETQDACLNNPLGHELPCPALPPAPDTRAPQIKLSSKAKQSPGKTVVAMATADEDVTFNATGSVAIVGGVTFSLVPTAGAGAANSKTSLPLGVPKAARKKIAKALKEGKKVRASVHVVAKDAAGNASNANQTITIARSLPKKHHS
jgi:hypothetical protein